MKKILNILITAFSLLLPSISHSQNFAMEQPVIIKMSLLPAGPYGGNWRVTLEESSSSSGAKVEFSTRPGLELSEFTGSSLLKRDPVQNIKQTLSTQKFYTLPNSISADAVALHQPIYRIEVCSNQQCHKVNVYDPATVPNKQHLERFNIIWDAIMENLPMWPSGWPVTTVN